MADQKVLIKAHEGIGFQGIKKSEEGGFLVCGYNVAVYHYKIDATTNTLPASYDFQTNLTQVHDAKVIIPANGTGNAETAHVCKPKSNGVVNISGLNGLATSAIFIVVAVGARV